LNFDIRLTHQTIWKQLINITCLGLMLTGCTPSHSKTSNQKINMLINKHSTTWLYTTSNHINISQLVFLRCSLCNAFASNCWKTLSKVLVRHLHFASVQRNTSTMKLSPRVSIQTIYMSRTLEHYKPNTCGYVVIISYLKNIHKNNNLHKIIHADLGVSSRL
jgi:hypothetical protein